MNLLSKNIYLILGIVLLALASYQFAFKKTIDASARKEKLTSSPSIGASEEFAELNLESKRFRNEIANRNISSQPLRSKIFDLTKSFSGISILSYNDNIRFSGGEFNFQLTSVSMEGSYIDLLSILDGLLDVYPDITVLNFELSGTGGDTIQLSFILEQRFMD